MSVAIEFISHDDCMGRAVVTRALQLPMSWNVRNPIFHNVRERCRGGRVFARGGFCRNFDLRYRKTLRHSVFVPAG